MNVFAKKEVLDDVSFDAITTFPHPTHYTTLSGTHCSCMYLSLLYLVMAHLFKSKGDS